MPLLLIDTTGKHRAKRVGSRIDKGPQVGHRTRVAGRTTNHKAISADSYMPILTHICCKNVYFLLLLISVCILLLWVSEG